MGRYEVCKPRDIPVHLKCREKDEPSRAEKERAMAELAEEALRRDCTLISFEPYEKRANDKL